MSLTFMTAIVVIVAFAVLGVIGYLIDRNADRMEPPE